MTDMEETRLFGMPEAERLIALSAKLYMESGADKPWDKLSLGDKRPWVDKACQIR